MRQLKKEVLVLAGLFFIILLAGAIMYHYDISPSYIAHVIVGAGGDVTQVTVKQVLTPLNWQGFYGELLDFSSSNQTTPSGGSIDSYNVSTSCPLNMTGEVYFSTVINPDFSSLVAGTTAQVDAFLGVDGAHASSATHVFTGSSTFEVNDTNITSVPTVTVFSQVGTYTTGILHDGSDLVFVSNLEAGTGYNGEPVDYQSLLPTPSGAVFYTFTDPGFICPPVCGDAVCEGFENATNCVADCSVCGDSICDATENATSCVADCSQCGDSICDATEDANTCVADCSVCGDSICDATENASTCVADCSQCGDSICDITENATTCPADCTNCGDSICDSLEDANSCVVDCTSCGDSICDALENVTTCVADCTSCGDNICDSLEDVNSCVSDCTVCGDSICDSLESPFTCSTDCGPAPYCGDGSCNATVSEDCSSCAVDCGFCDEDFGSDTTDSPIANTLTFDDTPVEEKRQFSDQGPPIEDQLDSKGGAFTGGGYLSRTIVVDPTELYFEVERGGVKQQNVRILNGLLNSLNLQPRSDGDITDFITIPVPNAIIRAGAEEIIPIFAVAPQRSNPGSYRGNIVFYDRNGKPTIVIPTTVKILPTQRPFGLEIDNSQRTYKPGSDMTLKVTFRNVPAEDVKYKFDLVDPVTQEVLAFKEGESFVNSILRTEISVPVPRGLGDGRFIVKGTAYYTPEGGTQLTSTDALPVIISQRGILYYVGMFMLMLLISGLLVGTAYLVRNTDYVVKHPKTATMVLYGQFDSDSGALKKLDLNDFTRNKVIFVESAHVIERKFSSAQKVDKEGYHRLTLFQARSRDFARSLTKKGFDVHYFKANDVMKAVNKFIHDHRIKRLYISATHDKEQMETVKRLSEALPEIIQIVH